MTREHKLALILGFALVLVVGVLVSDHISGAERGVASTQSMDDPIRDRNGTRPGSRPSGEPVSDRAARPACRGGPGRHRRRRGVQHHR